MTRSFVRWWSAVALCFLSAMAASAATLSISTTSPLQSATVGASYTTKLTASGGKSPYRWSVTAGSLPAGLSLSSAGTISGTPSSAGTSVITVQVTDSSKPTSQAQRAFTLVVSTTTAISSVTPATAALLTGATQQFAATVTGSANTTVNWSASAGTISSSGLYTAPSAVPTGGTVTITATAAADATKRSTATVTITSPSPSPAPSVSVSPRGVGILVNQSVSVTATTTDPAGVIWSAAGLGCSGSGCGTFSAASSASGVAVTYTPPANSPGTYIVSASSASSNAVKASSTVGVTDLTAVATYHNDASRSGANTHEYALSPTTVSASTFGKRFSCAVDGAIYAQPLWVANVTLPNNGIHNVVVVATQHNSVYAFDADSNSSPCQPLWQASLVDSAHGVPNGQIETAVPSCGTGTLVGSGYCDIDPEVGITGTPVIDTTTHTLYVVAKSVNSSHTAFYQRLHALDLTTGAEKFSGPKTISGSYTVSGSGGSTVTFDPRQQNQRAGLALANGSVYVAWASHEDRAPYYGWVMSFDASTLASQYVFNATPNSGYGGIWMGGGAPSVDASGNVYVITGNGVFNATSSTPPNTDLGDSMLQLSPELGLLGYFTPSDQASDNATDADFGSGGTAVLADLPANGSNPTHLIIGGGKDGYLYLINRDSFSGYGDGYAWERFSFGSSIQGTGAFWNSTFYLAGAGGPLQAFALNSATATITATRTSASTASFAGKGSTPTVSASGATTNGIVWALNTSRYCTSQSSACGAAILHAYNATNLGTELWNSVQGTGNAAGYAVKFTVPTVANGKVYIGTRGNNAGGTTGTVQGQLDVYGLLP